jgi:hypothetical protein
MATSSSEVTLPRLRQLEPEMSYPETQVTQDVGRLAQCLQGAMQDRHWFLLR